LTQCFKFSGYFDICKSFKDNWNENTTSEREMSLFSSALRKETRLQFKKITIDMIIKKFIKISPLLKE
ncbi:MAG: hypothetical protein QXF12_05510, partial [Candidatus Aenigmatarchaeota archaeon]